MYLLPEVFLTSTPAWPLCTPTNLFSHRLKLPCSHPCLRIACGPPVPKSQDCVSSQGLVWWPTLVRYWMGEGGSQIPCGRPRAPQGLQFKTPGGEGGALFSMNTEFRQRMPAGSLDSGSSAHCLPSLVFLDQPGWVRVDISILTKRTKK